MLKSQLMLLERVILIQAPRKSSCNRRHSVSTPLHTPGRSIYLLIFRLPGQLTVHSIQECYFEHIPSVKRKHYFLTGPQAVCFWGEWLCNRKTFRSNGQERKERANGILSCRILNVKGQVFSSWWSRYEDHV